MTEDVRKQLEKQLEKVKQKTRNTRYDRKITLIYESPNQKGNR